MGEVEAECNGAFTRRTYTQTPPSAPGLIFSRFFDEIFSESYMTPSARENSSALESRVTTDTHHGRIKNIIHAAQTLNSRKRSHRDHFLKCQKTFPTGSHVCSRNSSGGIKVVNPPHFSKKRKKNEN